MADFNNDGHSDIMMPGKKGSILWPGKRSGFERPVVMPSLHGIAPVATALGDFNGDGGIDMFRAGRQHVELWRNLGSNKWERAIKYSGTLYPRTEPGIRPAVMTDLNCDGRQDIMLFYSNGEFQYHFNRGFGTFGVENEPKLHDTLPKLHARPNYQSAAVADFNEDGTPDLVVAEAQGTVLCLTNRLSHKPGLRVTLASDSRPVQQFSVWRGKSFPFCLGVYTVVSSKRVQNVFIPRPGQCIVRWKSPGVKRTKRSLQREMSLLTSFWTGKSMKSLFAHAFIRRIDSSRAFLDVA